MTIYLHLFLPSPFGSTTLIMHSLSGLAASAIKCPHRLLSNPLARSMAATTAGLRSGPWFMS